MKKPRIVVDTNVFISALMKPLGWERKIVEGFILCRFDLVVSPEVMAEYRQVFGRAKFSKLDSTNVATLLSLIASEARVVFPSQRLNVSKDEDDNRFYECAEAGGVDYIVTGNSKHFTASHKGTRIVNARQFLELLEEQGGNGYDH